ncbi:Hsp20/alpha crystallin family protein [Comamonas sp. JC664]
MRLTSIEGAPRSIQRAWKLPASIDAAASKASLENGVLTWCWHHQPATQTLAIA